MNTELPQYSKLLPLNKPRTAERPGAGADPLLHHTITYRLHTQQSSTYSTSYVGMLSFVVLSL